ncbi:MAG: hypothetical protein JWM65_3125 [Sphingomonas bacterium]|nr:hypothetical protein [Sphingomonas bacterium]
MYYRLQYSRAKLWSAVLIFGLSAALFVALFTHPDVWVGGPVGILVDGDLGHFVTLPLFTLFCAAFATRLATMAAGPCDAVVTDPRGLRITTMWRSRAMTWSDLKHVALVERRFRRHDHFTIKFYRHDGAAFSIPLGVIALRQDEYEAAVQRLFVLHRDASSLPARAPQRTAIAPVAPLSQAGPPRQTFGRRHGAKLIERQ